MLDTFFKKSKLSILVDAFHNSEKPHVGFGWQTCLILLGKNLHPKIHSINRQVLLDFLLALTDNRGCCPFMSGSCDAISISFKIMQNESKWLYYTATNWNQLLYIYICKYVLHFNKLCKYVSTAAVLWDVLGYHHHSSSVTIIHHHLWWLIKAFYKWKIHFFDTCCYLVDAFY